MLLSFLCFRAQEQDTVSIDEIKDVFLLGFKSKFDCERYYNQEKEIYEKQFKELESVNLELLFNEFSKLEIFNEIKINPRKILILNPEITIINVSCGLDSDINCPRFENNILFDLYQKFWNKKNYEKFQKVFKNKSIIPLIGIPFMSFKDNMINKNNFLKSNRIKLVYEGVYTDLNSKKTKFYYSSNEKRVENLELHKSKDSNKILSENYIHLYVKLLPYSNDNFPNTYNIYINISNEENKAFERIFLYQFKDGKWKLLKNK